MNRLALVTGGAGFIGSHLVEHLLESGWKVRVLDDLSAGTQTNLAEVIGMIEFIQGSITDLTTVERAVTGVEVVFHLAAKVFVSESFEVPEEYERVNIHGTIVLLTAARKAGVRRIVFSSTCAVYGDTTELPIAESTPTRPLSPYASTKSAAEVLGQKNSMTGGPDFTVLRYFNVYGVRQNPKSAYSGVISRFADALKTGEPLTIYGDGSQTRDFIYVKDIVQANLLAALQIKQSFSIFNVGTGRETPIKDLFQLMTSMLPSRLGLSLNSPRYLPPRTGEIRRSVADVSLIKDTLGFSAITTLQNGISCLYSE